MNRFAPRTFILCAFMVGLFALVLAVPVAALATPGDGFDTAVPLTVGAITAGTLLSTPDAPAPYSLVYSIHLTRGQTILVAYTTSTVITKPEIHDYPSFLADFWLGSDTISPTVQKSWVLAPKTATYYLVMLGHSTPGTFTIDAENVPAISYSLSKLTAPAKAKKKTAFKVRSTLIGEFDEFNIPVTFIVERKKNGKFKPFNKIKGTPSDGDTSHVPFFAKLSLPRGTFRVHAQFTDAAHPKPLNAKTKTITVR